MVRSDTRQPKHAGNHTNRDLAWDIPTHTSSAYTNTLDEPSNRDLVGDTLPIVIWKRASKPGNSNRDLDEPADCHTPLSV